jgi:hypothetical protein
MVAPAFTAKFNLVGFAKLAIGMKDRISQSPENSLAFAFQLSSPHMRSNDQSLLRHKHALPHLVLAINPEEPFA